MAAAVFLMLLLGQLPGILVLGLVIESKTCGLDCIIYSSKYGEELFYINGYMLDKDLVCKSLNLHSSNGFAIEAFTHKCGPELSFVKLSINAGRKLLQKKVEEKDVPGLESSINPKKVTIAACGFLFLCCSILCPCFHARKKDDAHDVLVNDLRSSSLSSVEMNTLFEKIPGSPVRVPPGSPLRVPPSPRYQMSPKLSRFGSVHLTMNQIMKVTRNFSPALQIGEGSFGTVYKAQLHDGLVVAIKRAKKEHFETLSTEFSSEVKLLSKTDHRNLVKLLGYVDKGEERLIITEYVSNGTLREHLDGKHGKTLDFNQRLEISIDIAHGLTYLHLYAERQIIHRDVKASNILLTESFRAKVSDFGFARFGPMETDDTHVVTKVKGTVGYLDPEYMRTYQLTPKSDVYSFGVLLIEILTGRRPVELKRPTDERITLIWAFKNYSAGRALKMVDPSLEETVSTDILVKMFGLAIQCAAPTRSDRPEMKSVVEQLWRIRKDYIRSTGRA